MAHCTPHLNDAARMTSPRYGLVVAEDPTAPASNQALGCSSNGSVVACSFASLSGPNLIVYRADGTRVFAADPDLLDSNARRSAPIVFTDGSVLAADDVHLILFNPDGSVRWMTTEPVSGVPISPVPTAAGIVLIATDQAGLISTYDLMTGQQLATFQVSDPDCGPHLTKNTPAVNGNRVYVSSICYADRSTGGLAAIDVESEGPLRGTMTLAWLFPFTGPSGSSPLFSSDTIFFDGYAPGSSTQGAFMAVKDTSTGPVLLWEQTFPGIFQANAALDPRGGIWVHAKGTLDMIRLNFVDGSVEQRFGTPTPPWGVGQYEPTSAYTVALTTNRDVVLILGATNTERIGSGVVLAEDVTARTLLWETTVGRLPGNSTSGQFPIVTTTSGLPRVVFATALGGVYFIGSQ